MRSSYESRHEKTCLLHERKAKAQISCAVSASDFASYTEQSLYFLSPKFQTFRHLLRLHRPGCVGNNGDRFCRDAAHLRRFSFLIADSNNDNCHNYKFLKSVFPDRLTTGNNAHFVIKTIE